LTASVHAYGQHEKEVREELTPTQRALLVAGAAGSLLAGGAIGAALAGPLSATASNGNSAGAYQAGNTSTGGSTYGFLAAASAAPKAGTFKSNENATHEAGESAAREAQENSGQRPSGGFGPGGNNENAAHEQGESAAREAQENAAKSAAPTNPSTAPSVQ